MEDSSLGRLIGVLISPEKTFRSIAERPTWVVALVVLVLLGTAVGYLVFQKLDMAEVISQSMADRGQQASDEELERATEMVERFGWLGAMVGVLVIAPLAMFVFALILWVVFKLLGGEFSYQTSLSVTLHSLMPTAVSSLLSLPVIYSRGTIGLEESQRGVLFSNLGALAPEDSGPALTALLSSIDLFTIWTLVLLTIGFSIVGRVSKTAAGLTVVLLWVVYVLAKVGWVSIAG
ncbi:MAG: Yip1 family protein [Thermoanaerobaculia bacterium]